MMGSFPSAMYYPEIAQSNAYALQADLAALHVEREIPARDLYALLWSYYLNNGLYDTLRAAQYLSEVGAEALKEIRNPANRVVEVYAAKMLGGPLDDALDIEAENRAIIEPIKKVWAWSNLGRRKQVFSRWSAVFGTVFIKVCTTPDLSRVYFQLIHPGLVTEFRTDPRDFITYCRIDTPIIQPGTNGARATYETSTEIWDAEDSPPSYKLWEHNRGQTCPTDQLGPAKEILPLAAFGGIDFVPIVLHKHRDIGQDRGTGAFTHALTKIDEWCRIATRLHQLAYRYNRPTDSIMSPGRDASGRAIAPPSLDGVADGGLKRLGDEEWLQLPAGWEHRSLVPNVNYGAMLDILVDHGKELEDDLPEMSLARIREVTEASGIAIRYRMEAGIARIVEARSNAFESFSRADMMALTIGAAHRMPGFQGIGTFDAGAFEHTFAEHDVIELDSLTIAQEEQARATAFTTLTGQKMPPTYALQRVYDMTEAEAQEVVTAMAAQVAPVEVEQDEGEPEPEADNGPA